MNHDYAHCADYVKGKCPLSCFRAELTQDYENRKYGDLHWLPVSWMHFKGTQECLKGYKVRGGITCGLQKPAKGREKT